MLTPWVAALQRRFPRPSAATLWLENKRDSAHHRLPLKAGQNETGGSMKIHAPSETIFWIAGALLFLALFGQFVPDMGFLNLYSFWISVAASVVLILGCIV
jgi:hypothetical protein